MANIAIITGASGLVGAEAVRCFHNKGFHIVGIDNDMRKEFFGEAASTEWSRKELESQLTEYTHFAIDIRNEEKVKELFQKYGKDIKLIIHCAAQPSHDWAASKPFVDFTINANGTLILLEMTRQFSPEATFIFTSTNKVYGDLPNYLPLVEKETRWEADPAHPFAEQGIDETMSIDKCKHSLFGASKAAADLLVQEYGRYFGMKTACFRAGCITGPGHSGAMLHGFLAYLVKCVLTGSHYTIFGYKGKQVRDNIHCGDLVSAFDHFHQNPCSGEVYNIGGSRYSNCSMVEVIELLEKKTGNKLNHSYEEDNRIGDHIWWISDVRKFKEHYPDWSLKYNVEKILDEIICARQSRIG